MTNLYRLEASTAELASQFGVEPAPELRAPSPVRPGEPGLIVRGVSGRRSMHVVGWGFPRPGRDVEPSTVNLVADLTNFMWDGMVPDPRYRCLLPVSALGQPEGPKGFKTRTWFTIPEWPVFALAGFCRRTPEWGNVYAALTGDSNELVMALNDRSPIILAPDEYDRWLTAPIEDVIAIQFRKPFPAARMAMERSDELWVPLSERSGRPRMQKDLRIVNLYTVRKSAEEVARHFGVRPPKDLPNTPEEVYPSTPGLVIREKDGERVLQSMVWGFPLRLSFMKRDSKPKPVNNIADLNKNMWKGLAAKPQWRCLIPVTHFAEAEGKKGAMTRTWVDIKGHPIVAWGGLWRDSAEWGPVYSGVMTNANEAIKPLHDRMPVFLFENEWDKWMTGSFDDLLAFQARKFPDELIEMERTPELWVKRRTKAA